MHMPTKKYFFLNATKNMFNGSNSNCDRKSQLSGTLTEPLNSRERHLKKRQREFSTVYRFSLYDNWEKKIKRLTYYIMCE